MAEDEEEEKILGVEPLLAGKFLAYNMIEWQGADGVVHKWEAIDRPNASGAVLIVARLMPSDRILLIRQFRPPARERVYEFPAGLMDFGEEAETAARRELREETGYHAASLVIWPPAYTTPGMASEAVFMVEATIDEHAEVNLRPDTDFDDSENIQSFLVPFRELTDFYRRETAAGHSFDAKLAAYIMALMARE